MIITPPKTGPLKKVRCAEEMQVSGISYEGLWHQDDSSPWDGCVTFGRSFSHQKIDLGNGNFAHSGKNLVDASTTSFDNSSHF